MRLIDADAYRKKWADIFDSAYGDSCCEMFKKSIDEQPTADVRENVRGEWLEHCEIDGGYGATCNICGEYCALQYTDDRKFCPNCGALMSESLKVHEIGKSLVDGIQAGIKGEKE